MVLDNDTKPGLTTEFIRYKPTRQLSYSSMKLYYIVEWIFFHKVRLYCRFLKLQINYFLYRILCAMMSAITLLQQISWIFSCNTSNPRTKFQLYIRLKFVWLNLQNVITINHNWCDNWKNNNEVLVLCKKIKLNWIFLVLS